MSDKINIYVSSGDVTDILMELSMIDDIEAEIQERDVPIPDETKEHPAYNISPADTVVVLVSATSILTSSLALATAFLKYLELKAQLKADKEKTSEKKADAPSIVINNNYTITVSDNVTAEAIAKYLQENDISSISLS